MLGSWNQYVHKKGYIFEINMKSNAKEDLLSKAGVSFRTIK